MYTYYALYIFTFGLPDAFPRGYDNYADCDDAGRIKVEQIIQSKHLPRWAVRYQCFERYRR